MKKILGKCKCSTKITKFLNDEKSPRVDKINYKYTDDEHSKWSIFRCKNCKKPINERWEKL